MRYTLINAVFCFSCNFFNIFVLPKIGLILACNKYFAIYLKISIFD